MAKYVVQLMVTDTQEILDPEVRSFDSFEDAEAFADKINHAFKVEISLLEWCDRKFTPEEVIHIATKVDA